MFCNTGLLLLFDTGLNPMCITASLTLPEKPKTHHQADDDDIFVAILQPRPYAARQQEKPSFSGQQKLTQVIARRVRVWLTVIA